MRAQLGRVQVRFVRFVKSGQYFLIGGVFFHFLHRLARNPDASADFHGFQLSALDPVINCRSRHVVMFGDFIGPQILAIWKGSGHFILHGLGGAGGAGGFFTPSGGG